MTYTTTFSEPSLRTVTDNIPPERRQILTATWEFTRAGTGRVVTHMVDSSQSPMSLDEFLDTGAALSKLYPDPFWTGNHRFTTPG